MKRKTRYSYNNKAPLRSVRNKKKYANLFLTHGFICIIGFFVLFSIVLVFYGPFHNIRNNIVEVSMKSSHFSFFATAFLSRNEINSILDQINQDRQDNPQNMQRQTEQKTQTPTPQATASPTEAPTQAAASVLPSETPTQAPPSASPSQATVSMSATPTQAAPSVSPTKVQVVNIAQSNFTGKLLIISDPSKVVLGLSPTMGDTGTPLSQIVKNNEAIGGINAGGFEDPNYIGTGGIPLGIVIQNGHIVYQQSGIANFQIIGFKQDNDLVVSNAMPMDVIKECQFRCAVSFGPVLILNGQQVAPTNTSTQPRSAIGQKKDGTVLMLAIDGREAQSSGATLKEVADIMTQYGAYNAANLDGGSSSTMNYQGKTINNPCDIVYERSITTAFLIEP